MTKRQEFKERLTAAVALGKEFYQMCEEIDGDVSEWGIDNINNDTELSTLGKELLELMKKFER